MQQFSGIETFVKVADTLNFSEAGKRLGLSSSAVGKSVSRLEERLGARLFHRNTRSVRLTAKGEEYLEYCRRALATLDEADKRVSDDQDTPRGKLRVGMPLVCSPFQETLTRFVQQFPDLQLDLDFSDRLVDVIEEGFDLVVRTGNLTDSRLMSKFLGKCEMRLVATPDYLDRAGRPKSIEDLSEMDCLRFRSSVTGKLVSWPGLEHAGINLNTRLSCSHIEMLYYAACNDTGVACLPDFLIADAIEQGRLELVLAEEVVSYTDFHLIWPSSQWRPKKLVAAIDFLVENLLLPADYSKV